MDILFVAEALKSHLQNKAMFFVDSQAAFLALVDRKYSSSFEEVLCKETISHLIENGKKIVLQ